MSNKQKLELTWIGKNNPEYDIANIEPRILEENPELSNCSNDPETGNMIIHGDNLLALKALLPEYEGKVKCIYIDPPFNTGAAFENYDDSVEHSTWLTLMKTRFQLMFQLLDNSGILLVHLDDEELAYAKVLLDEIFGRNNYLNTISLSTNDPSGFKATASTIFSTTNYILMYSKNRTTARINKIYVEKKYDTAYSKVLKDESLPIDKWEWENIGDVVAREGNYDSVKAARKTLGNKVFDEIIAEFAIKNASRVFRTAAIGGGAKIKRQTTIEKSKAQKNKIFIHPNEDVKNFLILNGEQILFYSNRFYKIDGKLTPGQTLTDFWDDISWTGIANEGEVVFKNGKKPEKLIKRCLDLCTSEGDYILDSFLGSGTTASVAQKMKRKYIGIEMGEQAYTHCKTRLDKVINGTDQGGISNIVEWKGGGAYKFYELAPSFITKDELGNPIIDTFYYDTKLVKAMCKLMNYTFRPSKEAYWKHGIGHGNNYLYVTTQLLTSSMVQQIMGHLGADETLTICPKKYEPGAEKIDPRITIKKIPQSVLKACQFGKKEYLLPIKETALEEVATEEESE